MKITIAKEVIKEEIEIAPGTYYFEDENLVAYKFTLGEPKEEYSEFIMETLHSYSNKFGIMVREDGAWDDEHLPWQFIKFITGVGGKKIEKEYYYKERNEILEKLK